jgi:hypothetical protein
MKERKKRKKKRRKEERERKWRIGRCDSFNGETISIRYREDA